MRLYIILFAAAVGGILSMRAPASAAYIPPGSYSQSCDSIAVVRGNLNAKCQDTSGNWHLAQINIASCPSGNFANNDGELQCGRGGFGIGRGLPFGSWRATCNNATLSNGILTASCDNSSGTFSNTSLSLANCPSRNISNVQGTLVCAQGAFRPGWMTGHNWGGMMQRTYTMPGGSWSASCRGASVQGSVLTAQCLNASGNWVVASFNLSSAPGSPLHNANGVLTVGP